ncbi:MAG: ABC transporter substrate-binding protein, partial [Anaerolineae bacterium]|nr:ABC transporter substrate-binding protein [Anaerolineae bacterium]
MRKYIWLLLLVILALPVASVLGQGPEDTIIRSIGYDLTTLNPILWTDGGSGEVGQFLWSNLFEVDPLAGVPVPGLTSWEISADGLVYTFTIREGAVWSDGEPITANDVLFSFEAINSDVVESPRVSDMSLIESLEVVDDSTFVITLTEVNCTIWSNLASLIPLPSHRYAADFSDVMTSEFNISPDIASGPYILDEWQPDEFTRLRANPLYWGGEPQTPYLLIRVLPDPAIQNQALMTGDVDYAFMYPDELAQIPSLENLNVFSFPLHNTPIFTLNWADPENPSPAWDEEGNQVEQAPHPLFSDVRVRQAIA